MVKICLIEHGKVEKPKSNDMIGDLNKIRLNLEGVEQSERLRASLAVKNLTFDRVYSSPIEYAKQTAEIVFGNYEILPELTKNMHGNWEGKTYAEVYTPEIIEEIGRDPLGWKGHGGESQEDVGERMYRVIEDVRRDCSLLRVALITHKLPIRCLLRKVLNADAKTIQGLKIDNASITNLEYDNFWMVRNINHNLMAER